jgi:hypothetical protein
MQYCNGTDSPRNLTTRRYVLPLPGAPDVMPSPEATPGAPLGGIGEARQVPEDVLGAWAKTAPSIRNLDS